jgi:hypothetical protein
LRQKIYHVASPVRRAAGASTRRRCVMTRDTPIAAVVERDRLSRPEKIGIAGDESGRDAVTTTPIGRATRVEAESVFDRFARFRSIEPLDEAPNDAFVKKIFDT